MKEPDNFYQDIFEFNTLLSLLKINPPERILEIGSYMGFSSYNFLTLRPKEMLVIDKITDPIYAGEYKPELQDRAHKSLVEFAGKLGVSKMEVFERDSTKNSTVSYARSWFTDGIDFLFIDGGHDYYSVESDFNNYSLLVKPGGLIAFHDIYYREDGYAVHRFWNSVKDKYEHFEFHKEKGFMGIGVLKYK
jgi:predicted O-methyltransferase YrrM